MARPELDASKAFAEVDRMPDPAMLVAGMDATSRWEAVRELRALTAGWLRVGPGASVLDVGCGPGDVLVGFARATGPAGRAVGIDASSVMLDEARRRAAAAGVAVEFDLGDAQALAFADDTFDASRSERTFQWLAEPARALAEMVRVTRPGGTVAVIDTDWDSFAFEHPDRAVTARIVDFVARGRGEQMLVGRRLRGMFRRAGLADVKVAARAALLVDWDPDTDPAPPGFIPLHELTAMVVRVGVITDEEAGSWLEGARRLARDGDFCASLTMYAVGGTKPAPAT